MDATCAVCLGSIPKGSNFRLIGTEVVHPACVRACAITLGQRQRQAIAELRRELAAARGAEQRSAVDREAAVLDAQRARADARRYRDERDTQHNIAQTEIARTHGERVQLEGRVIALERQAAIAAAVGRGPESVTTPDPAVRADASEERFRLLEFD